MLWLLWVFLSLLVFIILLRIALVEYVKTIPNFGKQTPHIIEKEDQISQYKESSQWQSFTQKCSDILAESKKNNNEFRMYKKNTNTYRPKELKSTNRLNFNVFNNVIGICTDEGKSNDHKDNKENKENKDNSDEKEDYYWADVEASCTYDTFAAHCLKYGFIPTVTPELKSITVGGAIAGGGLESSSFRYGLVHESMIECDILLSNGNILTCNKDENSDLFYGIANSLGAFGYLLRCRMKIIKAKKYVLLTNIFCENYRLLSDTIINQCEKHSFVANFDFIDGIAYPDEQGTGRVLIGTMTDELEKDTPLISLSNTIYHRYVNLHRDSVKSGKKFIMTTEDYLWRWDADLFWCIEDIVPLQIGFVRKFLSKHGMRSDVLRHMHQKIFGRDFIYQTAHETEKGNEMFIQDIIMPSKHVYNWLLFHFDDLLKKTKLSKDPYCVKHPLWLCPTKGNTTDYPLFPVNSETINVNFGFWSTIEWDRKGVKLDNYIEDKMLNVFDGSIKMIYSTVTFSKEQFYKIYNGTEYFKLKNKYDKDEKIRHLYEKCTTK